MAFGLHPPPRSQPAPTFTDSKPLVLLTPSSLSLRLIHHLHAAGYRTTTLSNSPSQATHLRRIGCQVKPGSFQSLHHLRTITTTCSFAFASLSPVHTAQAAHRQLNFLRNLLHCCRLNRIIRLVIHTTEHALFNGQPIVDADESTNYPSQHTAAFSTRASQQLETLITHAHLQSAPPCVILRTTFLWGDACDPFLTSLLAQLAENRTLLLVRHGHLLTSTCHVNNACEAVVCALRSTTHRTLCYFITDGQPILLHTFVRRLCQARNLSHVRTRAIPFWLVWLFAFFAQLLALCCRQPPAFTTACVRRISTQVTFCDKLARQQLGYVGQTTLDDGMRLLAHSRMPCPTTEQ